VVVERSALSLVCQSGMRKLAVRGCSGDGVEVTGKRWDARWKEAKGVLVVGRKHAGQRKGRLFLNCSLTSD
jgi:hypothetical protein